VWTPVTAPLFAYRTSYLRRQLEQASLITSPSAFVRDRFADNGFPAGRILLTDYGTSHQWLTDFQPRPSPHLRFGFVGSVMRHKGVHTLIEAFNRLAPDGVELHIFGDPGFAPEYYAEMEALAQHPSIHFRGRFENDQVGQTLSELDVMVVPSIWYENAPITIHEARLAGIPVIGSRAGGTPEFVDHNVSGLLFEPGDVDDLCAQMQRLIAEPGLLDRLRRGVRPVKTMHENAREFESIYTNLIAGEP
jgi:glycosyltransferase involved in cell wall biosynthesis